MSMIDQAAIDGRTSEQKLLDSFKTLRHAVITCTALLELGEFNQEHIETLLSMVRSMGTGNEIYKEVYKMRNVGLNEEESQEVDNDHTDLAREM